MPEADVARVQAWCAERVPERVRDSMRIDCVVGDRDLTIVERHAPLPVEGGPVWSSHPVAKLRYVQRSFLWTLYWRDSALRYHRYIWLDPSTDVEPLLAELDRDPTALFWG